MAATWGIRVFQDSSDQRKLRQKPARPWNHDSCVRGRAVFCRVRQPGAYPSSVSRDLRLGNITQLPHTSVSSSANMISPLNCFPYDSIFRQISDKNRPYTSWGCCEDWWRSWKESVWHTMRSQKMWLFNCSWQAGRAGWSRRRNVLNQSAGEKPRCLTLLETVHA